MQGKYGGHPLDRLIKDNSIFMLEAMIPFVDIRMKKLLVFFIKLREITEILSMLDNPGRLSECGFDLKADSFDDMLQKMCDFLPDEIAQGIRQTVRMINMMKMMDGMNISDFPDFSYFSGFSDMNLSGQEMKRETKAPENPGTASSSDMEKPDSSGLFDSVMSILNEYDSGT